MRYNTNFLLVVHIVICSLFCGGCNAKTYNPLQYGLNEAKNGIERYWVLYKTHLYAVQHNGSVSYSGIKSIDIDIPEDAKTIPLTSTTNFCDVELLVGCHYADFVLFELKQDVKELEINKQSIDDGDFSNVAELRDGQYLVLLTDDNPWVKQRGNYGYGHKRKDVIEVRNGKGLNRPISPYNNYETKVLAQYCRATNEKKFFQNLCFRRKIDNKKIVYLLAIENEYNVVLRNIKVYTPESEIVRDYVIRIDNSAKIRLNNIAIEGTYSSASTMGYGITMSNVYDVVVENMVAHAKWGIFGNNNVNRIKLRNCDINRFDIHCYGRNVTCKRCIFRDLYNQFSSMYGQVVFQKCKFIHCTPVLFENSYNAFTKFDLVFKDCTIIADKNNWYLINAIDLDGKKVNERKELSKKEYPDLYIKGLKIEMPESVDDYAIYKFYDNMLTWPEDEIPSMLQAKNIIIEINKRSK